MGVFATQVARNAELFREVETAEAALQSDAADLAVQRAQLAQQQAAAAAEAERLAAQSEQLAAERSALDGRTRAVASAEAQAQVWDRLTPCNICTSAAVVEVPSWKVQCL